MTSSHVQLLKPVRETFKRGSSTTMFTQQISQHLLLRHLLPDIRETQAPPTGAVSGGFLVSRIASRNIAGTTVFNFDFQFNPKMNRSLVFDLATAAWIGRREDALFLGPSGSGNRPALLWRAAENATRNRVRYALGKAAGTKRLRKRSTRELSFCERDQRGSAPDWRNDGTGEAGQWVRRFRISLLSLSFTVPTVPKHTQQLSTLVQVGNLGRLRTTRWPHKFSALA
jgi:IstB-like ATP binding protein